MSQTIGSPLVTSTMTNNLDDSGGESPPRRMHGLFVSETAHLIYAHDWQGLTCHGWPPWPDGMPGFFRWSLGHGNHLGHENWSLKKKKRLASGLHQWWVNANAFLGLDSAGRHFGHGSSGISMEIPTFADETRIHVVQRFWGKKKRWNPRYLVASRLPFGYGSKLWHQWTDKVAIAINCIIKAAILGGNIDNNNNNTWSIIIDKLS